MTHRDAWRYVDGRPAGSHATAQPVWNRPFQIGAYGAKNYLFNGFVDDVALYGKALSASDIRSHYDAGR